MALHTLIETCLQDKGVTIVVMGLGAATYPLIGSLSWCGATLGFGFSDGREHVVERNAERPNDLFELGACCGSIGVFKWSY